MAQLSKRLLSGTAGNGRSTKVAATATPGTLIHTAITTVTTTGQGDELWLWAVNTSAAAVLLTLQWGGTTAPDDSIPITLPPNSLTPVVPGWFLNGGVIVRAFAATANVITIFGFANVAVAG